MIENILLAVIAGIMYSGTMYLKKSLNADNPQDFDVIKFISTVFVGAFVGIVLTYTGSPVSEQTILTQLGAYAGIIAITENLLKTILRYFTGP